MALWKSSRSRSGESLADSLIGGELPAGRWRAWLDRRVPPRRVVRLHQGNLFIFPPQTGLWFLLLVLLLILAAINYQNALVFGLAFLLASLFTVTIGHTFRNLSGLEIEASGVAPVFVGEHALFRIRIARTGSRHYHSLRIGWPGEAAQTLDLDDETEVRIRVPVTADHRGWLDPGRMRFETTWPLGLLRAWTWIDLQQRVLVYPRPLDGGVAATTGVSGDDGEVVVRGGSDDFLGLREYRPGDPLKHVAWKSYAREGEMMIKDFGGHADRRLWLDWDAMPGVDVETRLSLLTGQALSLSRRGEEYGLRLPDRVLEPAAGPDHQIAVLRALALYGLADDPDPALDPDSAGQSPADAKRSAGVRAA